MSPSIFFDVSLSFFMVDPERRLRVQGNLNAFDKTSGGLDRIEAFRFVAKLFTGVEDLKQRLSNLAGTNTPSCAVVVSDALCEPGAEHGWAPSPLARWIRDQFRPTGNHAGLVAVVPEHPQRTTDVDLVLDDTALDGQSLFRAIEKTTFGLRLKFRPHGRLHMDGTDAVRIALAGSKEDLRKSLQLRHRVYGMMGYLEDAVAENPSRLEMDSFDLKSLHFVATDHKTGEVVGTVRLVMTRPGIAQRDTIVGDARAVYDTQSRWCREIAQAVEADTFRARLRPSFMSLPIFQSFEFHSNWAKVLKPSGSFAEVSRVIVCPKYRGMGVSTLLLRAAIAAARDLDKRSLLLECIPSHAPMYAKYGFQLLPGQHARTQELDQIAVGMRLDLDSAFNSPAAGMADRDIRTLRDGSPDPRMLFGSKHLCLCERTACWRNGRYKFRGQHHCPLKVADLELVN